jgi:hypothetical protein
VKKFTVLSQKLERDGPQTDDELHAWIKQNLKIDIPRHSVCEDHQSPFKFIADCYFNRLFVEIDGEQYPVNGALALANRAGFKTTSVAALHFINAIFKPGCSGLSFGATEQQGRRSYSNIEEWSYKHDPKTGRRIEGVADFILEKPMKSDTKFKNGSEISVVSGSEQSVSGPHPCHPGDEQILTFDGYKRIDELDPSKDRLASYTTVNNMMTWGKLHGKIIKGKSSKYSGISWNKNYQKWVAQIHHNGQRKPIGRFDSEIDASLALLTYREDNPDICFPFEVGRRKYSGDLVVIETLDSKIRVTPNHIIRIKLDKEKISEKWVVYLMRRDNWWRIGKTKGNRIVHRLNEERADSLWIIETFDDQVDALHCEIILQAEYGITGLCFQDSNSNSRINNPSLIHDELSDCSGIRSIELLNDRNLFEEWPLIDRAPQGKKRSFRSEYWFDTAAGNAIALDGCIKVPESSWTFEKYKNTEHPEETNASVNTELYEGYVYSLEVNPYHYYVAGGLVVHNCVAHADEIDMMREGQWKQSRGMAAARPSTGELPSFLARFDGYIPPLNIATSTRNSLKGLMQDLIDEITEDLKNKRIPRYVLFVWCIWETIAEVPNCRCAPDAERKARLIELDRNPDELCMCDKIVKGKMTTDDGTIVDRTLELVCGGKAFRSRGTKPYVDLVTAFKENTMGTWTLQHECREGKDERVYIPDWALEYYGIRNYEPRPEYGPIYQGVDWGGTNPHAVLWIQYLTTDVPAFDFEYQPIYIRKDSYVCFKEIYAAGIDTAKLAKRIQVIENQFRKEYGYNWSVEGRFTDPQGKGDRLLFARLGLKSSWPVVTRNKQRMITLVQNLVVDDRYAVDVDQCPAFCEEIEGWGKKPHTNEELDKNNHAMSAWRYCVSNAEALQGKSLDELLDEEDNFDSDDWSALAKKRTPSIHHSKKSAEETKLVGPLAISGGSGVPDDFMMKRD